MDAMSLFRLDVCKKTGRATLLIAARGSPCGFKPVFIWPSTDGIKKFAEMLMDLYRAAEDRGGSQSKFTDAS